MMKSVNRKKTKLKLGIRPRIKNNLMINKKKSKTKNKGKFNKVKHKKRFLSSKFPNKLFV